jgi:hypothetical protein
MNRLAPEVVDRLIKLLGMLGSVHAGERAAAGLKADQLVRQHRLQWRDVIAPPLAPQVHWREQICHCLDHVHLLNARERNFIGTLLMWRGTPTPRQLAWLDKIYRGLP